MHSRCVVGMLACLLSVGIDSLADSSEAADSAPDKGLHTLQWQSAMEKCIGKCKRLSRSVDDEDATSDVDAPNGFSNGDYSAFLVAGGSRVVIPDPIPSGGPPDIETQTQLDALGPYIAPILQGGIGNVLFQLAALHVYAKFEAHVPCIVGFFDHWNMQYTVFHEWGGHTSPGPGLTLKHVFPNIQWLSAVHENGKGIKVTAAAGGGTVLNDYAFNLEEGPDQYLPMPKKTSLPAQVHGYFFNHRYWHEQRDYLLNEVLVMNPAVERYLMWRYPEIKHNNTVSVHLRFGYGGEPAQGLINGRMFPPKVYYQTAFEKLGKDKIYFVFADNPKNAQKYLAPVQAAGYNFRFVNNNVIMDVKLMSMCAHHVMTSSTLSFWGAYLDPRQPTGGKTILHSTFFDAHGRQMIPYNDWIVLEDV